MSKKPVYQVRFSTYPNFQKALDRVLRKAQSTLDFKVSRKILVLAGVLSLKHLSRIQIKNLREKLRIDKNPIKPENPGALHKAVELSLNDTALAKSIMGHFAFELHIHDISMRELYHIGICHLDRISGADVSTLVQAAKAIHEDLNA